VRIAIVVNSSWNIYNFRLGLAKAFLAEGHEVIAIAPEDDYSKKLKLLGIQFESVKMENKGSNPLKDLSLIFQLYKCYKKNRPDIILQFTIKPNIYGTIAAKLVGIPVINNVSGLGTVFLHDNFTSKIAKWLYKFSFQFPAKVFFQNNEDLQLFVNENLVSKSKTGLLPGSGVDTVKFAPSEVKNENKEFTFLMVSRLLYDKGIIEYIEAIKTLKNRGLKATFQVLGAIDESAKLGVGKTLVKQWENEGLITYLPFTDNLIPYYHQADAVVLPSYREGTPRSLLEAGACGLPLVATDVPGCRDVVKHNLNGFLCEVKNPIDLADKIGLMAMLPKVEYRQFAKASRKHILENFDEKMVLNAYFSAINDIHTPLVK